MNSDRLNLSHTIDHLILQGKFDDLMDTCKATLVDARQHQDAELEALSLIGLAQAQYHVGQFKDARVLVDGALQVARQCAIPDVMLQALLASGQFHATTNFNPIDAERDFREASLLAHDLKDQASIAKALTGIGGAAWSSGDTHRAMRYIREAFELARDLEDPALLVVSLTHMGRLLMEMNAYEKALSAYQDALKIAQDNDYLLKEIVLTAYIGSLLIESTHYHSEGQQMLQKAYQLAQNIRGVPHIFNILVTMTRAYIMDDDIENALKACDQAIDLSQKTQARPLEATAFSHLALLQHGLKQYMDAILNFEQAHIIFRELNNPFREAHIEQMMGMTYEAMHDYDAALTHYMAARAIYEAIDDSKHTRDLTRMILLTYVNRLFDRLLHFLGLRKDDTA